MARMIDADKIKQQLRYLVSTCERVGDHSAADNFLDCIVLVDNQPTLSQDAGTVLATDERQNAPCDVCRFYPPSSGDGKPCCICPADCSSPKGE